MNIEKSAGVIRQDENGNVNFSYDFGYYFFLGKALAERYEDNRNNIALLAKTSYRTDSAHTLLFLLHHSRSQDLLETILLHTMETLGNAPVARLTAQETGMLASALEAIPKALPSMSTGEARKNERSRRDVGDERELSRAEEAENEDVMSVSKVYRALRNMDILAQVLRNQYGSMAKERLEEIVNTVIDVGLQLIYMFTNEEFLANEERYIRKQVEDKFSKKKSGKKDKMDVDKITRDVTRQLRMLAIVIIGVLVEKILLSIWRRELTEIVSSVCENADDPAHKLIATLFDVGTRPRVEMYDADLVEELGKNLKRENNYVVRRILSLLVHEHLRTHDAPPQVRQRLFHALDVPYKASLPKRQR